MLKGKTVILGITGSIAAYKMANIASALMKMEANVRVIMTKNATEFINPITFETLTHSKCLIDTFDRLFEYSVEHIALSKQADLFLVAPASANVIGKIANGIADDMLTTTFMACTCPKLISPAMNTQMFMNPIVQDNIAKCKHYGMKIIEPASGILACGDVGSGRLPDDDVLISSILKEIHYDKDFKGKKVLISAGATMESIDPVRFISNHSTGKMGFALAKCAMERGAEVTVVKANTTAQEPLYVNIIPVKSAQDMFNVIEKESQNYDIIIKAAAVADYTPLDCADEKLKKKDGDLSIALKRTTDILAWLGQHRRNDQTICGFSMETQNLIENSKLKLDKKKVDMIVANNLKVSGAGFGTDTNVVTLITKDEVKELPIMSKDEVAFEILSKLLTLNNESAK